MPEMNNENLNVNNNVTVVPTEPVIPIEPVVSAVPTVEIPAVNVEETPVMTVAPVEVQPVDIPEMIPTGNSINEVPTITVAPDIVSVTEPVASVETSVSVETPTVVTPVVDNVSVINTAPEVVETVATPVMPVIDDIPVIETSPAVEEQVTSVLPPVENQTETLGSNTSNVPVNETSMVSNENTIINSVVSDVVPDVVPTPETVDTGILGVDAEPVKKEGKKIGLFIALGVVVIIIGVVLAFYFLVYNKPSMMFKTSLKTLKTQLNGSIIDNLKPSQFEFSLQTKINSNNEEFKLLYDNLNKFSFDGNIYLDLSNEIEFLKLNTKYQEKDLVSIDAFIEKKLAYFKLNNFLNKYVKVDIDLFSDSDNSDAIVVSHALVDALDKSLKEEYFTKLNKTVDFGGVLNEVVANTLVINGENIGTFVSDIVNVLKNNKEFLDAYGKINKCSNEDVVKLLDGFASDFSNLSNEEKTEINYQVVVYTKGVINKPVGFGVSSNGQAFDIYLYESIVTAYTTVDSSTTKVLDVTLKDNQYDINIYSGEDTYSFALNFKEVSNPTFAKPDVTNSVTMEELTEDDYLQIAGGFMQSPGATLFMTDFEEMISMVQGMMGLGFSQEDVPIDTEVNVEYDDSFYLE